MKQQEPSNTRILFVILPVILLDTISFGILIPLLPFYAKAFDASATVLGLLLSSFAIMQFFFLPFWGRLSDRFGRKKILASTLGLSSLALVATAFASSLEELFIARICAGIFSANISVASAYISDNTNRENRAKGMGMIGAAFGIGFMIGPGLVSLFPAGNYEAPILLSAALTLSSSILSLLILKPDDPDKKKQKKARSFSLLPKVAHFNPQARKLFIFSFGFTVAISQLETTVAYFLLDRYQFDARDTAYVFVLMALIMVLIQGGLIRRLSKLKIEQKLLKYGLAILAVGMLFFPFNFNLAASIGLLSLMAIGRGLAQPSAMTLISVYSKEDEQGESLGTYQSFASLARIFGPFAAGPLYDGAESLPFIFGTVLLVFLIFLILTLNTAKASDINNGREEF